MRPRERARRAIELMTQFSGASGGLLYLRGEDGLGLVSLAGDIAPTEVAQAALTRYFENECGTGATEMVVSDAATLSKLLTSYYTLSTDERQYIPVLLSHVDDRGLAATGIAVFATEPGASFQRPAQLAGELSCCVAKTGDAIATYI
jgi:hypothetical protein